MVCAISLMLAPSQTSDRGVCMNSVLAGVEDALIVTIRGGPEYCGSSTWKMPQFRLLLSFSLSQPLVQRMAWMVSPLSGAQRSEEHTSELQSRPHLVCRLLLEKKKKTHL